MENSIVLQIVSLEVLDHGAKLQLSDTINMTQFINVVLDDPTIFSLFALVKIGKFEIELIDKSVFDNVEK